MVGADRMVELWSGGFGVVLDVRNDLGRQPDGVQAVLTAHRRGFALRHALAKAAQFLLQRFDTVAGKRLEAYEIAKTEAVVVVVTLSDGQHVGRGEAVPYARTTASGVSP